MDLDRTGDGVSGRFFGFTALTVVAAGSLAALAWRVGWHLDAPARFWLLALFVLVGEFLPIPVAPMRGTQFDPQVVEPEKSEFAGNST